MGLFSVFEDVEVAEWVWGGLFLPEFWHGSVW